MTDFYVVADYREDPSEGIQVISKTLIDGLRGAGHSVRVVSPRSMFWRWLLFILVRPRRVIFTHGPGVGVVLWSTLIRWLTKARIVWVATRPDLASVPRVLSGRASAHVIIGNSARPDVLQCAKDAEFIQQYIGIDPARLNGGASVNPVWPELNADRPVGLHVGHLRRNRGLDLLAEAQRRLRGAASIVVLGSPTFPPDDGVVEELTEAGVSVYREYVDNLAAIYKSVDLYLFPVRSEAAGAIDLPLGVLEAVACGTPVISTPFGELPVALADLSGVTFADPDDYPTIVAERLSAPTLQRPDGLPPRLHADRVTDAVIAASGDRR